MIFKAFSSLPGDTSTLNDVVNAYIAEMEGAVTPYEVSSKEVNVVAAGDHELLIVTIWMTPVPTP